jgi:hypothetical protein
VVAKGRGGQDEVENAMIRYLIAAQLLLVGAWPAGLPVAWADEPPPSDDSVFEGQWSLEFSVSTKPGGATYQLASMTVSPHNLGFQAVRSDFEVNKEGTFAWEEREHGLYHSDTTLIDRAGQHSYPAQTQQPILRARGQVAKKTRTLTLHMDWSGGDGQFSDGRGGGSMSASADGGTWTISGAKGSFTIPVKYWQSDWELKPTRVEREETSAGVQTETVTYSATRQTQLPWSAPLPVLERLEVIQVRHLELVPRG